MDSFVWRSSARVVAYVDLILTVVSVALIVIATVEALTLILRIKNQAIAWVKLFGAVIWGIMTGVHLWAALNLLSATEVGEAVGEALAKSRIWWNVNVISLVVGAIIQVISICNSRGTEATVILMFIVFIVMFIVFEFIQELEMVETLVGSATRTNNL